MILCEHGKVGLAQLPLDVRENADHDQSLQAAVNNFERSHISLILELMHGNREATAATLGISEATLYRRLDKFGLKGD